MEPPGTGAFTSTFTELTEYKGFTDKTMIEGTGVGSSQNFQAIFGATQITNDREIIDLVSQELGLR